MAERALRGRFKAVLHYLPLAADRTGEDVEHVHQLRVWARRAAAALRLFKGELPRRRRAWLLKQLRTVRRAADQARDCDVLLGRPHAPGDEWVTNLRAERAAAQRAIVKVHKRLSRGGRLSRRVDQLLSRVKARRRGKRARRDSRFGPWAYARLRSEGERYFAAIPTRPGDDAALHPLRVRGKRLRYEMEVLAGAFPESFRTALYPTLERLQDRLGEINDRATAAARLRAKFDEEQLTEEKAQWRQMEDAEEAQLRLSRKDFWEKSGPSMLREMRAGFEALFAKPPRPGNRRHEREPSS
ncbi:CHAD domain-containing protein [Limnoglobus roseus]|uniref:CHAD domain-containing protein n=1 Tax=Limnoglobus roseus TaxID=2598579 RepID=A0A5C1AIK0_9BACT|nr:CHAD domain-containing protein [Limnoglobus roseus]QEL16798.1 CHAD domain-containing protein [Limnoglobus roseus]